jgi:hypothetical protein
MNGINISLNDSELIIKGNKEDLLELIDYISRIANSKNEKDHIHLDENSLIDNNSSIKELIIEKE